MALQFLGHGANVVGSLGSGSLVQDMPSAMEFNGTTTHASSSATWTGLNGATDFAVTWWQKRAGNQNARVINAQGTAGETLYMRFDGSGDASDLEFQANLTTTDVFIGAGTAGDFASDGTEWQHYACTYDGTNAYMYRNGVQIGTAAAAGTVVNATSKLFMGCYHSGTPSTFYTGSLRDMRIFTSGLTATQVTSVFEDTGMNGIGVTPVNWYYMEEGTGGTLNDSGSANIDLGIVSGSWDASMYNLNQIGLGSVSGSATISGGTWNLRDSTYLDFDGTGDYIDTNATFNSTIGSSDGHSWSFWAKLDDGDSGDTFVGGTDASANDGMLFNVGSAPAGQLAYFIYIGGTEYSVKYTSAFADGVSPWTHIVGTLTYTDATSFTTKLYMNGVEVASQTHSANITTYAGATDLFIASWNFGGITNLVDLGGDMRDVSLYNSTLTLSQIDLLYKGQWNGSPVGWWKLNEGTGATATDSGTGGINGTINNATWVNPDYDMLTEGGTAGTLVTISGAKLSAPRAELQTGQAVGHSIAVDTYIHNSGTLILDGNTGAGVDSKFYDYGNTYYNITKEGGGYSHTFYASQNDDTVVENTFDFTTSNLRMYYRLNMGTTGSRGTVLISTSEASALIGYSNFELYGVSELYPVLVSSSNGTGNWSLRSSPTVLSDVEVDMDWITRGDSIVHTLSGNCKFAGIDISATDTFNASGQRVEIGGLDGASACTMDFTDSLVYLTARYDSYIYRIFNAATFTPTRSTFVCDMSNAGDALGQMQSDQSFDNLAIVNDGLNLASGYLSCTGNLIIAAGGGSNNKLYSSDGNSGINVSGNVSIANGAIYEPDNDIATIGGNFNMAGGFIGVGALDVTGVPTVSAEYMEAASFTDMSAATEGTIECWFKADSSVTLDQAGMINPFNTAAWNITVSRPAGISYLGWEWDNGGTEIWMQNGVALTDDAWHHAAMTIHETNGYKVYLDAKLVASGAALGNSASKASPTLSIGATQYGGSPSGYENRCFDGGIARASVWKVALTETEIRSMLFEDWSTMAAADVIDDSKCVAWYEFSDDQGAASISDMSGSGNTGTLSTTDAWAGPGTFTYGTSTLKFDKAGTCNLYAPQDSTNFLCSGLTVTNGTTLTIDTTNDMKCYGLLVNSGSVTTDNNVHYVNNAMPIVDASSDLTFGGKIFYYVGAGIVSGAATTYDTLRPAGTADVYMQGDFVATTIFPQDTSVLHFNGYKGIGREIQNYGGGDIVMEAGSALSFTATDGFETSHGSNVTPTFIASGEAAAKFYQDGGNNWLEIPKGGATDFGADSWSVAYWMKWDSTTVSDASIYEQYSVSNMDSPDSAWPGYRFGIKDDSTLNRIDINTQASADTGAEERGNQNLNHDQWYHVTVVCSGSGEMDVYQYVDGVMTNSRSNLYSGSLTNDKTVKVGGSYTGSSQSLVGSIADIRFYKTALTSGNTVTLAAINPATEVSGTYADPDNDLAATVWLKLGATASGTLDLTSYGTSGTSYNATVGQAGTPAHVVKSGFVTVTGAAGFNSINRIYPAGVTLQNTYMSGSADIVVGQIYRQGTGLMAHAGQTFTTKGTVVLD